MIKRILNCAAKRIECGARGTAIVGSEGAQRRLKRIEARVLERIQLPLGDVESRGRIEAVEQRADVLRQLVGLGQVLGEMHGRSRRAVYQESIRAGPASRRRPALRQATMRRVNYAAFFVASRALRTCSAITANACGSRTARSESTLRSISMPAACRPLMNVLYDMSC